MSFPVTVVAITGTGTAANTKRKANGMNNFTRGTFGFIIMGLMVIVTAMAAPMQHPAEILSFMIAMVVGGLGLLVTCIAPSKAQVIAFNTTPSLPSTEWFAKLENLEDELKRVKAQNDTHGQIRKILDDINQVYCPCCGLVHMMKYTGSLNNSALELSFQYHCVGCRESTIGVQNGY